MPKSTPHRARSEERNADAAWRLPLDDALGSFPGIVKADRRRAGSHVHHDGENVILALGFDDNGAGRTARLVADFIMSRMGSGARLDGRAPVRPNAALACPCAPPDALFYACTKQQAAHFARMLSYASPRPQGPERSATTNRAKPLSVLLSHAFAAFEEDYLSAAAGDPAKPSLGVWSNALRGIGDDGVRQRDLPKYTILSRRTVRAVLRDLERLRWVAIDKRPGGSHLRLTDTGRQARDAGPALIRAVEDEWRQRFGTARVDALRASLTALVNQLDIELPWCLTGYGLADASVTGGSHVAAQVGPPRVPAHGQDWPVVLREPGAHARWLPLPALLSQALAAFTIDYEWEIFGYGAGLNATSNLLQFIGDDGMPLARAAALGEVRGNGKAGLERHLVVVVAAGKPRDGSRLVYLTPKGRRARDSHGFLLAAVERDWQARTGRTEALREALEALDQDLSDDLPNYPSPTAWIWHSMNIASGVERKRKARGSG